MASSTRHLSRQTTPSLPLPTRTYDSHMHIVSPDTTGYPLSPSTTYTPAPHTLEDMTTFYNALTPSSASSAPSDPRQTIHPVFIQPSPYGTDNSLLVAALETLNSEPPALARGIVVIDPKSPPSTSTLQEWHALGVRGVRINLVSVGRKLSPAELEAELMAYADIIRPLGKGWVLQLYISLDSISALEEIVPKLGDEVRVVIDHLGSPTLPTSSSTAAAVDPATVPGFDSLVRLLEAGNTYVKISGTYRLTRNTVDINDPSDTDRIVKALLKVRRGERCVWASDWPHTRFENKGIDTGRWVIRCWDLVRETVQEETGTGSEEVDREVQRRAELLFWGNAERLWN
jgi:predicted TIM-barrel fold metal-dependent hydrolase